MAAGASVAFGVVRVVQILSGTLTLLWLALGTLVALFFYWITNSGGSFWEYPATSDILVPALVPAGLYAICSALRLLLARRSA